MSNAHTELLRLSNEILQGKCNEQEKIINEKDFRIAELELELSRIRNDPRVQKAWFNSVGLARKQAE